MAKLSLGGHFDAFVERKTPRYSSWQGYESARAGLVAVLTRLRPDRLFLPSYRCSALSEAAEAAGVEVVDYAISDAFAPILKENLTPSDIILVTDYFGLCASVIAEQEGRFPSNQLIVDRAQAWFAPPSTAIATLYSPRKFLPVADGGLVATALELATSSPDEDASKRRYQYLIDRVSTEPEQSRSAYLESEASLSDISLRSVSDFTRQAIGYAPEDIIIARRIANFEVLDRLLADVNEVDLRRDEQIPLCYPLLMADGEGVRRRLLDNRIFVPRYWPNVEPGSAFEDRLCRSGLFLPIDHRYGPEDMESLAGFIKDGMRARR